MTLVNVLTVSIFIGQELSLKSEKNTEKLAKLKKQLDFEATQTLTSQVSIGNYFRKS